MLGIAGARHFLRQDGYTWVAPLSAFYPEANLSVDVQAWPPQFPKATLVADRNPASRARLRPDYIALRPVPGGQGVGVRVGGGRSEGRRRPALGKPACPSAWYKQARNVALTVNGEKVEVLRHLVVATRVNPNAMKASTRRLQIRAWNRRRQPSPETQLPLGAYVDIASAHRFGIFRALRLRENALALLSWSGLPARILGATSRVRRAAPPSTDSGRGSSLSGVATGSLRPERSPPSRRNTDRDRRRSYSRACIASATCPMPDQESSQRRIITPSCSAHAAAAGRRSSGFTPAGRDCGICCSAWGSTITPPGRPRCPPGDRACPFRRSSPSPGPALAPRLPPPGARGPVARIAARSSGHPAQFSPLLAFRGRYRRPLGSRPPRRADLVRPAFAPQRLWMAFYEAMASVKHQRSGQALL
jgi:hypothetical protein